MKNIEKLTIKNPFLKIGITKIGAELCSIQNKDGKEFMWQADPAIWGSHAPVLFPIIGALKNGFFNYKGKKYSVPKHGFIRHNEDLTVKNHSEDSISFQYKYSEETLKNYPFKFEFLISFSLHERQLKIFHEVINHGDNELLFSLGGHPAFKCPLNDGEKYSDYELQFSEKENSARFLIDENGLQNGKTEPFFNDGDILPLTHDLFKSDALIFKDLNSKSIHLAHTSKGKILTVRFSDFDYVGIWAKTNGDFICIEPWLGITDHADTNGDIENKEGILRLSPKNTFRASYTIEIHS
ncbi:aldose 1-epimerase family protein [Galbibacter mesophilus]|uniref:aldose 1-epimerase family protein n=1 Tax=Galbibacter mesophilus TaxID=379069 RepID=UPI00191DD576|nr:aldose 1-epimerase family protein [Galbibacter mesophilus]MCM5662889.1 aldose 1-epimerase family protein [Galbibacter mesophilus]